MAHTIMQVSTDFTDQHALPGISGKSIVVETPGLGGSKKWHGRENEEGLSRFKVCMCGDTEQ